MLSTVLNLPKILDPRGNLSSEQTLHAFEQVISSLGFDWEVCLGDIVSNAMVIPSKRKFIVNRKARFSNNQIKRFVAHEIFGHIVRAECGRLQPFKLFSIGLPGYESTEEGLALYKERKTKVNITY